MSSDNNRIRLDHLISVFEKTFFADFNVKLVAGGDEPVYLPADDNVTYNRIIFTNDYFSSALHEIAHWCIAGPARLQEIDFGYWYVPDGRTPQQQIQFEQAEVKPQALEWIFSVCSGQRFTVSTDNLSRDQRTFPKYFARRVYRQVLDYCDVGLPARANVFAKALSAEFDQPVTVTRQYFRLTDLAVGQ